jgi:hypothetical protein
VVVAGQSLKTGSPGSLFAYAPDPLGRPAWPFTYLGFFAGIPGTPRGRPLGIGAPAGAQGAPALDAAGRLVGIALDAGAPDSAGAGLVGLDRLRAGFEPWLPQAAAPGPTVALGLDACYESALRGALQVLLPAHG